MFAIPLAIHRPIMDALPNAPLRTLHAQASAINLAISVAIGMLVFVPWFMWKFIVRRPFLLYNCTHRLPGLTSGELHGCGMGQDRSVDVRQKQCYQMESQDTRRF